MRIDRKAHEHKNKNKKADPNQLLVERKKNSLCDCCEKHYANEQKQRSMQINGRLLEHVKESLSDAKPNRTEPNQATKREKISCIYIWVCEVSDVSAVCLCQCVAV